MLKKAKLLPPTDIKKIANAFCEGKVICLPTDTVYAISCDATNDKAIHRIYDIKQRALNKPLSIFVSDIDMAIEYAKLPPKALLFAKNLGPLTIIVKKTDHISLPSILVKNGRIGIRVPDKELIQNICASIKRPIIATSANISSKPNINSIQDIEREFADKVDVIVENNESNNGQDLTASTTIEFTDNNSYKIIREGRISKSELVLMEKL